MAKPWLSWIPERMMAAIAEVMTTAQTSRTKRLLLQNAKGRRSRQLMADAIPDQVEHFVASGLEFGYAYDSPLIDTAIEGPCPDGDVFRYSRPRTPAPGYRTRPFSMRPARPHPSSVDPRHGPDAVHRRRAPLVRESAARRYDRPDRSDPLVATSPLDHEALLTLLEIGDRGAVLVRPDGHVVWRSRVGSGSEAVELWHFLERRWSSLYPVVDG